jgi:hypothetical protein
VYRCRYRDPGPVYLPDYTGTAGCQQLSDFYRFFRKRRRTRQFVESIHYRDFSRHFDVSHAPVELKTMRKVSMTSTARSKDQPEKQYLYLQRSSGGRNGILSLK